MCGIVGFAGKEPAAKFLLEGLSKLEYRGYDSAGIATLSEGGFTVEKSTERIESLKADTADGAKLNGNIGIGHTRWATHGAPSIPNAHPHLSADGNFAVVHNGIIENYSEIKAELESEGFKFVSQTDTEVIPMLLQKYYKGDLMQAVRAVAARLEGSYALGILCADYPETIVATRKFSPLIIGIGEGCNIIASDVTAIVSHTKNVIFPEDGEIAFITADKAELFDANGNAIEKEISAIGWDVAAAEKGGYDHFMMKEIKEQPRAIAQTVESRIKGREIVFEDLKLDTEKLKSFNRIQIIACGSAYHAGIVGKYVFEELLRIPTEVDIASEYRYRNPITDDKTLVIIISQSGETADTLAALKEARELGAHTLAIVNVVGSSIAKAADDIIYTWAGPEIAVATTKGYTTQLAVIYMFAVWAARKLGSAPVERIEAMFDGLLKLPEATEKALLCEDTVKEAAKDLTDTESMFFIGRNIDYAVALEASLKLKEISYIHSEAYAAGELKHGTISLIEEDRTVVALCSYQRLLDKMLSNVKEVSARGGHIVACTTEGNTNVESNAQRVIYIPETDPLLTASVEIIPFQLYSYYVALYKGCDIDKPRNLAKSVTVE